jgi:hypothetical protein
MNLSFATKSTLTVGFLFVSLAALLFAFRSGKNDSQPLAHIERTETTATAFSTPPSEIAVRVAAVHRDDVQTAQPLRPAETRRVTFQQSRLVPSLAAIPDVRSVEPGRLCRPTEECMPPTGIVSFADMPPPFNMPVVYAGDTTVQNAEVRWTFKKAGAVTCTPQHIAEKASYGQACRAVMGEVVFTRAKMHHPPIGGAQ